MKKFLNILIIGIVFIFGSFVATAHAAPLEVTFTPNPLFNSVNFAPGNQVSGTVTVANDSGTSQNLLTEAINISDPTDFGDALRILIKKGETTLFDDVLSDFFAEGELPLGLISTGTSETFTYTVSFVSDSGNSYQGKTLGFDVCVGFEGGTTHCGDTVIGDENDTDNGGGGGGGGGTIIGSGNGPFPLVISNEQTSSIEVISPTSATATITWNTNLLATSQVVFGPTPGPYTLDVNILPNLGYPSGTVEDSTKVSNHSVLVTGLTPGQTYLYRVVSRASPATVSFERRFTVPLPTALAAPQAPGGNPPFTGAEGNTNQLTDTTPGGPEGAVLGEETAVDSNRSLAATALSASFHDLFSTCSLIGLLFLVVLYLVWKLLLKRRYEMSGFSERALGYKFLEFFGGLSLLGIIVAALIKEYCVMPVLVIVCITSIVVYVLKKLNKI